MSKAMLNRSQLITTCLISIMIGQVAFAGGKLYFKNLTLDTKSPQAMSALMSLDGESQEMNHYIVQYKNTISVEDQQNLKDLDIRVLRYVPDDAYIIQVTSDASLRSLNSNANVQALVPYVAELKANYKLIAGSVFNKNAKKKLHIRAFENVNYDLIEEELLAVNGLEILDRVGGAFIVNAPVESLSTMARIDGIEWIDEKREFKMQVMEVEPLDEGDATDGELNLDDLTGLESGTKVAGFDKAWAKGYTGKGQLVGVSDTGLDTGDETTLNDEFGGLKKGIIGGMFSSTWGDSNGHGTHVAGSIVMRGTKSNSAVRGGAYGADLVAQSLWSEMYGRLTIGPDPTNIFEQAYEEGVRVHSNSWGSAKDLGAYDDSARAVDEFMWKHQDMLLVFAAGNSGEDADKDGRVDAGSIASPASAKNVLTVGASENMVNKGGIQRKVGELGNPETGYKWPAAPLSEDFLSNNTAGIAAFSSRGPTKDKRMKPDIVAPGTNILSACSKYSGAGQLWGKLNDDLCFCGGTSMSTPLVSAGAVIVREYLGKVHNKYNPTSALIKAVLMHTTDDLYPGQFGEVGELNGQELLKRGPNNNQGFGRMNVDTATAPKTKMRVLESTKGVKSGESRKYVVTTGIRKITLAYTDAPGTTSAEKALVNDLDITVTTMSGKTYYGNSKVNNVEQIELSEEDSMGALTIEVKGANVPMLREDGNGQTYALVYSK